MKFTEQLIKRAGRLYWRGSRFPNWDKEKSPYDNIYLTASPTYALRYAKNREEDPVTTCKYLTSYVLKTPINLFNARASKDQKVLETVCRHSELHWLLKYIHQLKHDDWNWVFPGKARELFLKILQTAGYDGFTNIESIDGSILRSEFPEFKSDDNPENLFGFSGIGVFDINNLNIVKRYSGWDEIKTIPLVEASRKDVVLYIQKQIYVQKDKDLNEVFNQVWKRTRVNQLLTKEEVWQAIEDYDESEIEKIINRLKEDYIQKRERWQGITKKLSKEELDSLIRYRFTSY